MVEYLDKKRKYEKQVKKFFNSWAEQTGEEPKAIWRMARLKGPGKIQRRIKIGARKVNGKEEDIEVEKTVEERKSIENRDEDVEEIVAGMEVKE